MHRLTKPVWDDAMAQANRIMEEYLQQHSHIKYYVLTDPDMALLHTKGNILLGLLASCSDIKVLSPHLQISNPPARYHSSYQQHSDYEWEL